MRGLNDLVQAGKVLYLGISDAPAWQVVRCNMIAERYGWAPFVVYQVWQSTVTIATDAPAVVISHRILASVLVHLLSTNH